MTDRIGQLIRFGRIQYYPVVLVYKTSWIVMDSGDFKLNWKKAKEKGRGIGEWKKTV